MCVKSWEIIADRLSKAGWSLGWVSAIDSQGRTIWIVDAHRDDGRRFIFHASGQKSQLDRSRSTFENSRVRSRDSHLQGSEKRYWAEDAE